MKSTPSLFLAAAALTVAPILPSALAANKYDPLPFEPVGSTVGQALLDMEMYKHPEVKTFSVHVTLPGIDPKDSTQRRLLFSNIGRIGKLDDEHGAADFKANKERTELDKKTPPLSPNFSVTAPPKYEVVEALHTRSGEEIGIMVIVFPYRDGADLEHFQTIARSIAADFKDRIEAKDDLFQPIR